MLNALLWNLLLTAGLAVVLAILCRLPSLRRQPAIRHWLWLLLLVKLVTPPLIAVPLLPVIADSPETAVMTTPPERPTGYHESAFDPRAQANPGADDKNSAFVARDVSAITPQEPESQIQTLFLGGLLAISLTGTCVLLTAHGVHAVKLIRWLRRAATKNPLLAQTCAEVASGMKIRGVVRSGVVDARTTPLLCGWRRPLVVVPRQLMDELSPQQLRGILAHELAHLARCDHWANLFVFAVKTLMWWNPVVWWADRELRAAQELCCDAMAIDRCSANRRGYASTLLKALEFIQTEPLAPHALVLGMGSRKSILRRFEMIGETKLSYQLSRWSFLALLVLVVPLVCIPVHGQEEKQKSAVPATPTASDAGVKQDTTAKKAPEQTANTDEIPGLDPKIKELGEAVKKRMNAWSDAETLTLKEGETGRMKVKKNVTPVAEILITPHFAENGIKYDLKGVDAAGKPVAGTERTSLVIPFGQPVSTGLGTSFRIDGKHFMTLVLLKATSQGDRGVVVEAKANFMQVATAEELEAMLLATQGKQGRVKADFMKIDRGISVYRSKTHRYPKNLAELSQPIPKDYYSPTGEIYHYEVQQARYILSSCGPDGVYGNDDDIMEITNRRSVKSGIRQQLYPLPAEKDDDVKAEKEFGEVLSQNYTVSQNGKETVRDERPRGNCSISGKVISATTGKPVESARMYLFYLPTYASVFVNTAGDGTFVFKDIPKGPYSLQVSHTPGYQDASYNPESKPGPFPQFSLKDGEQRTGVDFKVEQAYRISGKILDENGEKSDKIHSLTVLAWFKSKDNKTYENTQAQINPSDGSYTIDGLAGKPTYVMAINWQAAREGNTYPPIYYPGTFSRNDAKLVTFDKKQSVDNVDITLKKEGGLIIEGTVRDEAGKPVPEAFVVVHRRDMLFDFNTAYTDKEGRYQIQGLGDGEFLVHVDAVHRGLVRMRTPVDLGKTSRKTQCDFTLNRGVLISGKFVDEKGNDWQIGSSYGDIHIINKDQKNQPETSGTFSLTNFRNKYRPKDTEESSGGSFDRGEGVYKTGDMLFPTKNTFIIQGMMPGHTMMTFAPQKEGQKVVKILYDGRDIQKSGIETKPGQEIKDVTIVIGKE